MNPANLNDSYNKMGNNYDFILHQLVNKFAKNLRSLGGKINCVYYEPNSERSRAIEMFPWRDFDSGTTVFMCEEEIKKKLGKR